MKCVLPGRPSKPEDLKAGDCFLFDVRGSLHLAIALEADGKRYLLDLDYENESGQKVPFVAFFDALPDNEDILILNDVHVRSKISDINFDYQIVSPLSLYITPTGPVIRALTGSRRTINVNIETGNFVDIDLNTCIRATAWSVECISIAKDAEVIREFGAPQGH